MPFVVFDPGNVGRAASNDLTALAHVTSELIGAKLRCQLLGSYTFDGQHLYHCAFFSNQKMDY